METITQYYNQFMGFAATHSSAEVSAVLLLAALTLIVAVRCLPLVIGLVGLVFTIAFTSICVVSGYVIWGLYELSKVAGPVLRELILNTRPFLREAKYRFQAAYFSVKEGYHDIRDEQARPAAKPSKPSVTKTNNRNVEDVAYKDIE